MWSDVSGRRALHSASTNRILVPPVTSTTIGSRAFSVAAPLIWNSLQDEVISVESLPTFQRKLKRHLFCQSFPGFCYWHLHLQWTLQWQCHLGHSKNTFIDWLACLIRFDWLIDWLIDCCSAVSFLVQGRRQEKIPNRITTESIVGRFDHQVNGEGLEGVAYCTTWMRWSLLVYSMANIGIHSVSRKADGRMLWRRIIDAPEQKKKRLNLSCIYIIYIDSHFRRRDWNREWNWSLQRLTHFCSEFQSEDSDWGIRRQAGWPTVFSFDVRAVWRSILSARLPERQN